MEEARRTAFAVILVGTVLCGSLPVVADDDLQTWPDRIVAETEQHPNLVSRFWKRNLVWPAGFATEPITASRANGLGGHSEPKTELPSWTDAGTLFRWSFSNASGGPNLDEPLVTDRPDFTEATSTVGRCVAQVEFGYTCTYGRERGVSIRTQSLGEPLLRYGVFANWLEFRAALFPVAERTVEADRHNHTAGTEDLYLGFKIGLTPKEGALPEMSLIPQMTVPTGSAHFTSDEVGPGVNWCYGWEITDKFSTGGSTQFNRRVDDTTGRSYLEYAQSWTSGFKFNDKLSMYAEWFALIPHSADTARPKHFFNFGFAYLVSNDIQWDIRYGVGLNRAAEDFFAGTGLSIRFK
jgi:Putative MetA-pathway of phenol degradation